MAATLRLLAGNQRDDVRDALDLTADLLEELADG
jgi:hypothetical protein